MTAYGIKNQRERQASHKAGTHRECLWVDAALNHANTSGQSLLVELGIQQLRDIVQNCSKSETLFELSEHGNKVTIGLLSNVCCADEIRSASLEDIAGFYPGISAIFSVSLVSQPRVSARRTFRWP